MQYIILNESKGYALYRQLDPGEEVWYIHEPYRLRYYEKYLWLRLEYSEDLKKLENQVKHFGGVLTENNRD